MEESKFDEVKTLNAGSKFREAVICSPLRTPVGRFGGVYRDLAPHELGAVVVREITKRTGLPLDSVDEIFLGNCYPTMDAPAIGRVVALDSGLPVGVGGLQIDRRCGSGLQAVINAAMQIQTGVSDLVLAGGVESMSRAPFYNTSARNSDHGVGMMFYDSLARGRVTAGGEIYPVPGGMIETAENLRRTYEITRLEQDTLALNSHVRATAAQESDKFDEEIVPVLVKNRKGDYVVTRDEPVRRDISLSSLSSLRPVMLGSDAEATVTAGNACGQSDGASICIVTHPDRALKLGLQPLARLAGWASAGVAPNIMGIGPVPATKRVLDRVGIQLKDVDLIELNEAFAAQVLACTREWEFSEADFDRLNVNGSGISLGHAVGSTGGRMLATLLHEMKRRGSRFGLETMCIGGGQGLAALFEWWS